MRFAKILCFISILCLHAGVFSRTLAQSSATNKRIVIAASVVLDGQGHVLRNTRIVIEGSKIFAN